MFCFQSFEASSTSIECEDPSVVPDFRTLAEDGQPDRNKTSLSVKDSRCATDSATSRKSNSKKSTTKIVNLEAMCDECGFVSKTENSLKEHKYTMHASKSELFKCIECPKTFPHRYLLKKHARVHSEPEFKCDQCASVFKTQYNLVAHSKSHLSIKHNIVCNICPQAFTSQSNLRRHVKAKHSNKLFECSFCKRTFNRLDNLERHIVRCGLKFK